ncbi:MAG: hypothetical protein ACFFG0_04405 [Candidatus Thorarchaeota archaeon]
MSNDQLRKSPVSNRKLPFEKDKILSGRPKDLLGYLERFVHETNNVLNDYANAINQKINKAKRNVTTNSTIEVGKADARSTGTVANGFGPRISFKSVNDAENAVTMGYIEAVYADVTDGSEDVDIRIGTMADGVLAERARINDSGVSVDEGLTYLD